MDGKKIVKNKLYTLLGSLSLVAQKAYLKDAHYIMKKTYRREKRIMSPQEALCIAFNMEYKESDYVREETSANNSVPATQSSQAVRSDPETTKPSLLLDWSGKSIQ